jgi:superfamily I DNA and/or RNA helicase
VFICWQIIKTEWKSLQDVTVQVVDNYQGEENDIILLSLVRSNKKNEIGYLKNENRVCVALSRAKHGMYIIGNMSALATSSIWQKIKRTLESQNAIGRELPLW